MCNEVLSQFSCRPLMQLNSVTKPSREKLATYSRNPTKKTVITVLVFENNHRIMRIMNCEIMKCEDPLYLGLLLSPSIEKFWPDHINLYGQKWKFVGCYEQFVSLIVSSHSKLLCITWKKKIWFQMFLDKNQIQKSTPSLKSPHF